MEEDKMKPSEKLWFSVSLIAFGFLLLFAYNTIKLQIDADKEFSVPVKVTRLYINNDYSYPRYMMICKNDDYGTLEINTTYDTYTSSKVGDDVSFSLSKSDIDRYGNTDLVSNSLPFRMAGTVIILILTAIILVLFLVEFIPIFNDWLDNKVESRKIKIKNKI